MRLIDPIELKRAISVAAMSNNYKTLEQIIDEQPTIEERKKGKWITMSDADGVYWVCSECGEDIPRISHFNPQFDLFPRLESIDQTYFCPNCGADMRGREDDKADV